MTLSYWSSRQDLDPAGRLDVVVRTEHGTPAEGGLLDVLWTGRREDAFDEGCRRR
jgi:hypothetical protein